LAATHCICGAVVSVEVVVPAGGVVAGGDVAVVPLEPVEPVEPVATVEPVPLDELLVVEPLDALTASSSGVMLPMSCHNAVMVASS
jgi:hypothetical protein